MAQLKLRKASILQHPKDIRYVTESHIEKGYQSLISMI